MIGLVLAAAMQIAPGTYTYSATFGGAKVATSVITVKNVSGATQIDEKASGATSGENGSASAVLDLGPDLSPVSYSMTGSTNGSQVKDSATIANATANVTNVHGASTTFDLMASTKHFVIVDFGTFAGFMPLAAQMRAWNNAAVMVVIPVLGQSVALVPSNGAAPARPSTVPAADQSVSFDGQAPFTIWYDPTTNVPDEIDVTAQGLTVTRDR